jgi:hypothetical protein
MKSKTPGTLWHQSGVNMRGEPFIQLTLNENVIGQFTPAEARDFARTILEAAEAAETDAFLMQWVTQQVGAGPEQAAGLLADFRRYREELTGKKHGAQDVTDWVMPFDPTKKNQ